MKKSKNNIVKFKHYYLLSKKIKKLSLTRALQYEQLERLSFLGKLLDFGGGEGSHYRKMLNCSSYSSVNIDPKIKPTWVVDIGKPIPCTHEGFDTVISLNTIEHIFDANYALNEMFHALKLGGKIILTTPFLFHIHGHPDDYFRPTPSWYKATLSDIGFNNIKVELLYIGPFTTGSVCSGQPGPLKTFRMRCSIMLDLTYHYIRLVFGRKHSEKDFLSPLALWVTAEKIK